VTSTSAIEMQMAESSEQAKDALAQLQSAPSPFDHIEGAANEAGVARDVALPLATAWEPLLSKVAKFTEIVDGISEVRHHCTDPSTYQCQYYKQVHPYAKMAWTILSAGYKVGYLD
jgi:hypothetical protein